MLLHVWIWYQRLRITHCFKKKHLIGHDWNETFLSPLVVQQNFFTRNISYFSPEAKHDFFLHNIVLEYTQTFIPEMWWSWTVEAIPTVCHSPELSPNTGDYQKTVNMLNAQVCQRYDRVSYSGYHLYTP